MHATVPQFMLRQTPSHGASFVFGESSRAEPLFRRSEGSRAQTALHSGSCTQDPSLGWTAPSSGWRFQKDPTFHPWDHRDRHSREKFSL